ncbi:carbohydrate binding domain-containing protein [Bacillus sp. SM2101]|uniref:carbohydrate binding domain-containing protein n=1 Tax=Bacillus sp. SM2101 TaxID=2805366 RepID=UPI001BDED953
MVRKITKNSKFSILLIVCLFTVGVFYFTLSPSKESYASTVTPEKINDTYDYPTNIDIPEDIDPEGKALLTRTKTEADEDKVENWELTWSDEFDGEEIDRTKWTYEIGNGADYGNPGWGNSELEYYTDEAQNSYIEDGNLVIKAVKEEIPREEAGQEFFYTSAKLTTSGLFSQAHGRIEVRALLPEGDGLWSAIWTLGENFNEVGWLPSGEIDIMELIGREPETIAGTLHGPLSSGLGITSDYSLPEGKKFTDDYHVYSLEWDEDELEFYVDDTLYHIVNKDESNYEYGEIEWVYDNPQYLILNLAVGGHLGGAVGEDNIFPSEMKIDYVRVYEDTNPETVEEEMIDTIYETPGVIKGEKSSGIDQFKNGNFDNGTDGWDTYVGFAGDAEIATENGETKIAIKNEGEQFYSIQYFQGFFDLVIGKEYVVEFDARSTIPRQFQVVVDNRAYERYLDETFELTDSTETYSFKFVMPANDSVSFKYLMGLFNEPIGNEHNIYIDNVVFKETGIVKDLESKNDESTDILINNGSFDDSLDAWETYILSDELGEIIVEDGQAKFAVKNEGDMFFTISLNQMNIGKAKKGQEYRVTFDANSSLPRKFQVIVDNKDYVRYLDEVVDLTTENKSYEFIFTIPNDDDINLKFFAGLIDGEESLTKAHDIFIDNVKFSPTNLVMNGTFEDSLESWEPFLLSEELGEITVEEGKAKIMVQNEGDMFFTLSLNQMNVATLGREQEYIVKFDASSTLPRKLQVIVDNKDYVRYLEEVIDLTAEDKSYEFKFTMPYKDDVNLKFFAGLMDGEEPLYKTHEIFLDNVSLTSK